MDVLLSILIGTEYLMYSKTTNIGDKPVYELLPNPVARDATQLWKWVQYYINNYHQSPHQIQKVLSALKQSYWQGVISWDELLSCEQMLPLAAVKDMNGHESATDLTFALSQIGHTLAGEYLITDICGFIDQGIVFQAQKNQKRYTLLCLTVDEDICNDLISQFPQTNQLALANVLAIDSIIHTKPHVFLVSSGELGQPLCAWLIAKYPLGLPKMIAELLLQQLYQLILKIRSHCDMIDSLHPGQLFIDPDCLSVQWVPCVSPLYYATQASRARLYQAPRLFERQGEMALSYRLMAIAYELYTGSLPDKDRHLMLADCKELNNKQKQTIEQCLILKKSLRLSQAAEVLGACPKKYSVKQYASVAVAAVLALAAFQGISWIMQGPTSSPAVQTHVFQQEGADQHINLLKAAFFNHIQENNLDGANVSWQALQQLLPQDDVFIEKVGPELIAKIQSANITQRNQKSVQVPDEPVPQALAVADPTLPPLPEIELPDEMVSPAKASQALIEQQLEALVMADPCQYALQGQTRAACTDALSDMKFGPSLLVAKINANQSMAITKQAISIADYNQYCMKTQRCKPYQDNMTTKTVDDLGLNDIESVVSDYNAYCLVSGSCEPVGPTADPVLNLTPKQIQEYAAWLSQETGYTYRLPTAAQWQAMNISNKSTVEWVLDNTGKWITTAGIDPHHQQKSRSNSRNQIAFRLVREIN